MRIGEPRLWLILLMPAVLTMALGHGARAGAMQVTPVLVDAVGQTATTITLRNAGDYPLDAQVRVFRWSQDGGADRLEPTDVVVASPPLVTLRPNTDYAVRLVHQGPMLARGEESYRVLIDELPNAQNRVNGVALLVRQSIPVFFAAPQREDAQVTWRLDKAEGALIGVNAGDPPPAGRRSQAERRPRRACRREPWVARLRARSFHSALDIPSRGRRQVARSRPGRVHERERTDPRSGGDEDAPLRWAIVLAAIAAGAGSAHAEAAADAGIGAPSALASPSAVRVYPLALQLDVSVNGRRLDVIGSFRQLSDGKLVARVDELASLGVEASGHGDDWVSLASIPGLAYVYDEPSL
jgi:P pilus assembly chaperone PapD